MHSTHVTLLSRVRRHGPGLAALTVGGAGCLALMRFADRPLALHFQPHTGWLFHAAASVTNAGEAIWWLLPTFLVYLAARVLWRSPLWAARALFLFAAVAGSGIMVDVIKPLLGRARPVMLFQHHIYGFTFLHFAAAYESFPSGHAACATGAGLALGVLMPRYRPGWVALGLLLGLTRVIVTAHYLSDVVAAVLVSVWTVVALERLFARHGMPVCGAAHTAPLPVVSPFARRLLGAPAARTAAPATTGTP